MVKVRSLGPPVGGGLDPNLHRYFQDAIGASQTQATQNQLDAQTRSQFGVNIPQSAVSGAIRLPQPYRTFLRQYGVNPDDFQDWINQQSLAGQDYQARVRMGQGNLPPVRDLPKLDQNKQALFSKVQAALSSGASDQQKTAVVREAFGGPNGSQLAQEYGLWADAQRNTGVAAKVIGAVERNPVGHQIAGAFGNVLSGVGAFGALGREAIATLLGSQNPSGQRATAADVGHQALELPKGIINVLTLGAAGTLIPQLKAQDRAPGWAQIAETTKAPLWKQLAVSPLGTATGAARKSENRWVRDLGNVLGMGMDVATDPASYASFGSGAAGKAATSLLGDVAERATVAAATGAKGSVLANLTKLPMDELLTSHAVTALGEDGIKAARDAALANRVTLTNLAHKEGFKAYAAALADTTGADANKLFPRVVLGGKRDLIGLYSRGGFTLRGGVPFGPRFGVNVRAGTGVMRGVRPLGSLFLTPGNRFTELVSKTLDQLSETWVYGAGANRRLVHENPGLYGAAMSVQPQIGAVLKQAEPLTKAIRESEAVLKPFRSKNQNANLWIYDMIENGQKSRFRAALDASTDFTPRQKQQFIEAADHLRAQIDLARDIAKEHNVAISTLRELASGDEKMMERYYPHKVRQAIGQAAGIAVAPTTVGPARARTVRAGTTIVGWAGDSQKLEQGSFAEIQDAMIRLWGPDAAATWIDDPIKVGAAYVNSVIHAAAMTHGYQLLADAGLIVPDLKNFAEKSIGGAIPAGDAVRAAWMAPREQADAARATHEALQGQLSQEVSGLVGRRVDTLEQAAQMRETIMGLGDRATMHDTQIGLLGASREYKQGLENLARADYQQAVANADAMFTASRDNTLRSVGAELRGLPEVKARLRQQIEALKTQHTATLRSLQDDLNNKLDALHRSAPDIERQMLADIKHAAAQANSGLRPLSVVREEIAATRQRLAQLEGGELAAAQRGELAERALRKGAAARKRFVARQRTAAVEAEQLGSEVERAQAALRKAERAGGDTTQLQDTLTQLQTRRSAALRRAEQAGQQTSGIADMLSTAEAAMRVADMREGQRLAAEAGASFDLGRGLSPRISEPIARLLRFHAADLAREEKLILARSPEIKWTNEAASWSREKLGGFGLVQPDGASRLGSMADRVNQLVDAQARQLQNQWRTAVGDTERTFQKTLAERKRQLSAALARETDLQERAVKATALDPRLQALSAAQKEGDQLNMFSAELDKDMRQLEAWIDNRDEIKKAMALTSAGLREVTDTDQALKNAAYAAQSLLEQDKAASGEAIAKMMSDARIFELMAPHVEHAAAIAGKLPFIEGGVVMPRDVADVLVRLQRAPSYRTTFGKVLAKFNTRWKRGVLLNPGSVVRRVMGNVYNAVVLQGVPHEAFDKAFAAYEAWHGIPNLRAGAKALDNITDPTIKRYLKLAMEWNIFEGEISAMPVEGAPFSVGRHHPIQRAEEFLQQTALHGEDITRLAAFIHGLDSGMSPQTARMFTGRYHFFNTELTERERAILRPAYPFYAYLRNNTALQVYTLFHNPGKIALYGYATNDLSAPVEGQGAPSWVTQQGGFALPWHIGDSQVFLANSMLDTSSLAIPYNLLGLEQGGERGGLRGTSPLQGDLTSSLSPFYSGGIGLLTGRDVRQGGESFSKQEANPNLVRLLPILKALGAVDDQGRLNSRVSIVLNQLAPLLGNVERVLPGGYGGLTASQAEQQAAQVFTKGVGPQFVINTPRQQAAYLKGQGSVVDQTVPASKRPQPAQLTSNARIAELLAQLGYGGS